MNYQEKIIMGAIIGTAIAGGVQINQAQAATQTGYTKTQLNLRSTASTSGRVLTTMPKGAKVTILSKDSYGWCKIQYGTKTGYCSGLYISTTNTNTTDNNTTTTTSQIAYTTEKLNLRASSSTSGKLLATMPKGAKVTLLGKTSTGWCKVKYNGISGFCSGYYISKLNTTNNTQNKITSVNYIEINRAKHTVSCYYNNTLVKTLLCCVGKSSTPTPSGNFRIISREMNRPYYKRGIPGGDPKNPLGTRFLQLTSSGYAIHGTNEPNSIGYSRSHGCIRLHNCDVEWLYTMVRVGCNVTIK